LVEMLRATVAMILNTLIIEWIVRISRPVKRT